MPTEPQSWPARITATWKAFILWPYSALVLVLALLVPIYVFLVPWHHYADANNVRALVLAFLCGGSVGMTEISSRYRDEQMKAILSPDGLVYILCNGAISTFALLLIFHFSHTLAAFADFKNNPLPAAIAAGFGATAIMRARFAVIKGADNKDISIGPDIVINLLLAMIDRRIDRWRAARRQEIVAAHFGQLQALGTVDEAGRYLLASLVAFQNLSEPEKKELADSGRGNRGTHPSPAGPAARHTSATRPARRRSPARPSRRGPASVEDAGKVSPAYHPGSNKSADAAPHATFIRFSGQRLKSGAGRRVPLPFTCALCVSASLRFPSHRRI